MDAGRHARASIPADRQAAASERCRVGIPEPQDVAAADLRFDSVVIGGTTHHVLRFSNVVWNGGDGALDLRGVSSFVSKTTKVYQRIYDTSGAYMSRNVGEFVFHPEHDHFHFEGFSNFELWTKAG
ncbi:MAG: hypothetical protein H0V86_01610 [Chloroflexia bacterium]|nr:hypothetical protein [Chloroflexia bacterium]